MTNSKLIRILLIAIFSACLLPGFSVADETITEIIKRKVNPNIVTKESISDICPKLKIEKDTLRKGILTVSFTMPIEKSSLENLYHAELVAINDKGVEYCRIPVHIYEPEGENKKIIRFSAHPKMLSDASLNLSCKVATPSGISAKTLYFDLPSLLDLPSPLGLGEVKTELLNGKRISLTANCFVSKGNDVAVMIGDKKIMVDLPEAFGDRFEPGEHAWIGLTGACRYRKIDPQQRDAVLSQVPAVSSDGFIEVEEIHFYDQEDGHKESFRILEKKEPSSN